MAAVTPASHIIENAGSKVLHIATFADTTDNDDAWTSKIGGVVAYWANGTDDPTQTKEGIDVSFTATNSVFTFRTGEDNRSIILYVLSNG
jgi:hypothetical protein